MGVGCASGNLGRIATSEMSNDPNVAKESFSPFQSGFFCFLFSSQEDSVYCLFISNQAEKVRNLLSYLPSSLILSIFEKDFG